MIRFRYSSIQFNRTVESEIYDDDSIDYLYASKVSLSTSMLSAIIKCEFCVEQLLMQ